MNTKRRPRASRLGMWVAVVSIAALACACTSFPRTNASGGLTGGRSPVPCANLETLRALRREVSVATNPRTGHSLEYVVMGDGARSSELILMFNGTSGILPDWPLQMLTNKTHSPRIARTEAYNSDEEGPVSLCHDYRLVLFDYPGVGHGRGGDAVTFDQLADDVDAMLTDIGARYGLPTDQVDLVGWSLGTLVALKYAFLSPAARPERQIRDVILIATKPGGAVDGIADGHGSQCVTGFFEQLKAPDLDRKLKLQLESDMFKLLFPYEHQQPYNGPDSGCVGTVDTATKTVSLNVTPQSCSMGSQCRKMLDAYLLNRVMTPWSETHGVSQAVFLQQRELVHDWNNCSCATAGSSFNSTDCSCARTAQLSAANGGVCQSRADTLTPNAPVASRCVPLNIQDSLTVINGREDLFIQWTYGKALVEAYQEAYGPKKATLVVYDGTDGAGHGVLMQHPRWTQERIHMALQDD